ncbi:MAG: Asp-tRNA(Asn)/Glu-tRNA(Gln) amidotransferase subunit GatC [Opitutales bacterium]|nr:Asp-tRNA(Asn)/Glu-tRNA(Gln) amidotransferase subunit GatC [Opitutales bacterium]
MEKANIDIEYVAKLARIELTEEEKSTYSRQLGQILGYFERLSEIDVSGVEPSAHARAVYNVMRDDAEGSAMPVSEALMNAPKARDNQISVPKVVEDA